MSIDWEVAKIWFVVIALIAFNGPIAVAAWKFRSITGLGEVVGKTAQERAVDSKPGSAVSAMLQEKTPEGEPSGTLSYSRVTGLIGAVVVASLFWIMSNVAIADAIIEPEALPDILNGVTKLFFVGAALFLPYAFNQLKALIQ
jgi:hypothetical protein